MINLDLEFLRSYAQTNPDPWGTSQPHNAYMETSWFTGLVVGHETRLASGQITPESVFHQSVMYSPTQLQSPKHMIAMNIVEESFGSGFRPQYPILNEFEQYCKDHWGTGVRLPSPHFFSVTDRRSCYSWALYPVAALKILGSLSDRNG